MNTDLSDYFTCVNLPIDIVQDINEYVRINDSNFFISHLGQFRINFNSSIISKLLPFIPFTISDCGVFKNIPESSYPIHKDKNRKCALNMLLIDNDDEFQATIYDDSGNNLGKIPYVKHQWILLNTKKFHGVKNNSLTKIRYNVSIGSTVQDYNTVRNKLLDIT